MPELPEVETVVRTLRSRLIGQRVAELVLNRTDVLHPPTLDLAARLSGQVLEAIDRRGKKIVFRLRDGNRFFIHLGMTGQLTVEPPATEMRKHTHFVFKLPEVELRFRDPRRFGGLWWLGTDAADTHMGPEPLGLRASQLAQRLVTTRRAVKSALLDQAVVAGLGNIYVDESLFKAGIHPLERSNLLTRAQVKRLNTAIQFTLRNAIRHRGSTLRDYMDADGASGAFQKRHRVYDRGGQPCQNCRSPIEKIVLGGRSTHFCPTCQKR